MNMGINRGVRGNVTLNEASGKACIDNRTIINLPPCVVWAAAGIALAFCATAIGCRLIPQEVHHTFNDNAKIQISSAGNGGLK